MITSAPIDLDPSSQFLNQDMEMPMNYEGPGGDRTPMNLQPQLEQQNFFSASPDQTFSPMFQLGQDSPAGTNQAMDQSLMEKVSGMRMPDPMQGMNLLPGQESSPPQGLIQSGQGDPNMASPHHTQQADGTRGAGLGITRAQFTTTGKCSHVMFSITWTAGLSIWQVSPGRLLRESSMALLSLLTHFLASILKADSTC